MHAGASFALRPARATGRDGAAGGRPTTKRARAGRAGGVVTSAVRLLCSALWARLPRGVRALLPLPGGHLSRARDAAREKARAQKLAAAWYDTIPVGTRTPTTDNDSDEPYAPPTSAQTTLLPRQPQRWKRGFVGSGVLPCHLPREFGDEPEAPVVNERCGCHGPHWCARPPDVSTEPLAPGQLRIVAWDWARGYLRGYAVDIGALRERCNAAPRRNGRRRALVDALRDSAPSVRAMVAASLLVGVALTRRPLPSTLADLIAAEEHAIAALLCTRRNAAPPLANSEHCGSEVRPTP